MILFHFTTQICCLKSVLSLDSIGQCTTNLTNTVLKEGDTFKFSLPIDQNFSLKLIPANSFFNQVQMVYSFEKGLSPAFNESLSADPSGLTIVNASTSPAKNKTWCPTGLYMLEDTDDKCNVMAKVVVISTSKIIQLILQLNCICSRISVVYLKNSGGVDRSLVKWVTGQHFNGTRVIWIDPLSSLATKWNSS